MLTCKIIIISVALYDRFYTESNCVHVLTSLNGQLRRIRTTALQEDSAVETIISIQ